MKSAESSEPSARVWLLISLTIPMYFGLMAWAHLLRHPYIVQDDARLHVVWLQRWVDPLLFPNDIIADYYTALQSMGFKALYGAIAQVGIEPMLAAKLLPVVLALIATAYVFHLTRLMLPHPLAGCLAALLLNQNIWIKDDLISATPRAFVYPLFAAFLYYVARRSRLPCLVTLVLQGLMYPQVLLVSMATLTVRLVGWRGERVFKAPPWQDYVLWGAGLAVTAWVGLFFSKSLETAWGELATAAQMQAMPEFGVGGRRQYFGVGPLRFWFQGASGVRLPLFPPILWVGCLLPLFFINRVKGVKGWRWRFPLAQQLTPQILLLAQVMVASLGLFGLAHLTFPRLYLPSRYTFYSSRVVMAIAAALVLTLLLDAGWRWWQSRCRTGLSWRDRLLAGLMGLFAIAVVTVPAIPPLALDGQGWIIGHYPGLYGFLAQQPRDIQIASLAEEADNLPAFSQRSVLVSKETALAYHPRFYERLSDRAADLLRLHYSPELAIAQAVIRQYGIDYVVVDREFATVTYLRGQSWLVNSVLQAEVNGAIAQLQQGVTPALTRVMSECIAFSEENLIVLDGACIRSIESEEGVPT